MSDPHTAPGRANGTSTGFLDDYPDVDRRSCQLLGPIGLIVQALMGVLVLLSLLYKRYREKPRRPWRIWLFDVSKQVVGQMFVHGVNVLVSDVFSHHSSSNACVTYFLNILIDTTLGVALLYVILKFMTFVVTSKIGLEGFESGKYGSPPSFKFWLRQAVLYVIALTTMKFLVIGLLALFPGLDEIAAWLLKWTWTEEGDALQVIFTMGIFPIIMNILQFWIIDSIVKASGDPVKLDAESGDGFNSEDREPLFRASQDSDNDDDGIYPHRHGIGNPPSPRQSRSKSRSVSGDKQISGSATPQEIKSTGSGTPNGNTERHEYPPSLSSSVASASTIESALSVKEATKLNKKRPTLAALRVTSPNKSSSGPAEKPVVVVVDSDNEWEESWGSNDDWAERVGEEDWTGRRLTSKKDALRDTWQNEQEAVS